MPGHRRQPVLLLFFCALLACCNAFAQEQAACLDCHTSDAEVPVHAVFNTLHGSLGGGSSEACTACHGTSSAHDRRPRKNAPDVSFGPRWSAEPEIQNGSCLACHEKGQQLLWHSSVHQQEELTCAGCHNSHQQSDPALDTREANQQCASCHPRVRAEAKLSSRHPIEEGKTACTDCHNPHGSLSDAALHQLSVNDNCVSCHQEYRGPFLWEHQPVTEDCTICHRPHGSVNSRLLSNRGPALCQQCHAAAFHPSLPYGAEGLPGGQGRGNENLLGKNCMNCHSQVHGSNHPSGARLTR